LTMDFQTLSACPSHIRPSECLHDGNVDKVPTKFSNDSRVISGLSINQSSDLKLLKQIFFQVNQTFPILIFNDRSITFRSFGKIKVQSYNSAPLGHPVHLLSYVQKFLLSHDE
jgi:hypothetical protein